MLEALSMARNKGRVSSFWRMVPRTLATLITDLWRAKVLKILITLNFYSNFLGTYNHKNGRVYAGSFLRDCAHG